eukprot:gene4950-21294_t
METTCICSSEKLTDNLLVSNDADVSNDAGEEFGSIQIYGSLIGFLLCEYGNFVIHCLLRDLRPPGTKERRIPYPAKNPLSWMFKLVSCPNYTYEIGAWMFFTTMTQTLTVLLTVHGFVPANEKLVILGHGYMIILKYT